MQSRGSQKFRAIFLAQKPGLPRVLPLAAPAHDLHLIGTRNRESMMKDAAPQTFYLKDYTPFGYEVEEVHLTFRLAPQSTRVLSRIRFAPRADAADKTFFLHGEDLKVIRTASTVPRSRPRLPRRASPVRCPMPPSPGKPRWRSARRPTPRWKGSTCRTACIAPNARPRASARSPGIPDRPDVMSPGSRCASKAMLPVQAFQRQPDRATATALPNGHDPWPKPAYLFALVAGDLVNHPDRFTTRSGKAGRSQHLGPARRRRTNAPSAWRR